MIKEAMMKIAQSKILKNLKLWAFFMLNVTLINVQGVQAEEAASVPTENKSSAVEATTSEETTNLEAAALYKDQWLCRNSQEVRTLRVEKYENSCNALYNKLGQDHNILSSKNKDNCTPVVLRVKGNLETAGWKCKDISDSLITIQ